jgi:hypothetical protein
MKEITRQTGAVLDSDLLEEAKLLWIFLFVCRPGGIGLRNMALQMRMTEDDGREALEVLKEAGIVEYKAGKWKAKEYLRAEAGKVSSASKAIREAAEAILSQYQNLRSREGLAPLFETRGALRDFERLAEWLNEYGVDARDYLPWAVSRCAFLKSKGIPLPAPNVLAGTWLRQEWTSGGGTAAGQTPAHAGKAYSTAAGLRERLVAAGFERARGFTKADVRHIESWAMDMVALPDDFPEPDPEFEREILWLRGHLTGSDDVPSS